MVFTIFSLVYKLFFEEFLIHNSRGFMILKKFDRRWACAIFRSIPNLQACTGRTQGRTDKIIWGGLGYLRFLQVNMHLWNNLHILVS